MGAFPPRGGRGEGHDLNDLNDLNYLNDRGGPARERLLLLGSAIARSSSGPRLGRRENAKPTKATSRRNQLSERQQPSTCQDEVDGLDHLNHVDHSN